MEKNRDQLFSFDNAISQSTEPLIVSPPDTGQLLADARKKMHLSAQDVAETLKLTENIIVAIENRDYDQLYGVAYATGYVRSYAKLVNLNPNELIRNDPALGIIENESNLLNTAIPTPAGAAFSNTRWIAVVVRAMIIASIIIASFAIWIKRDEVGEIWTSITMEESSTDNPSLAPESVSLPNNEPPTDDGDETP